MVRLEGVADQRRAVEPGADELRTERAAETEEILEDQHLAVDMATGADPDGGDLEFRGHGFRRLPRHGFEHDGETTDGFELEGLIDQYLERDGAAYPSIPGLDAVLAESAGSGETRQSDTQAKPIHLADFSQTGGQGCGRG